MERLTESKRLEKDVQIDIHKRPIKIAFFISDEENETNHLILDEIFKYSYTCWGGARFLILPLNSDEENYLEWLSFYDADIVYSYIKLTDEQIQKVENINSPALLIEHDFGNAQKYFSVNIPFYNPIKSISTVYSPYIFSYLRNKATNTPISLITQFSPETGDRFITDNFGNQLDTNMYLNEIREVFNTYCLSIEDIPPNNYVGTTLVKSRTEILDLLANREATTVAHLARIHTESIETVSNHSLKNAFSIVIGSSVKDRISLWNIRHFHNSDLSDSIYSLIISEEQFNDNCFLKTLGKYLSNLNFLHSGSGPYQVSLFSQSLSLESLEQKKDILQEFTYNSIIVPSYYSKRILPIEYAELKYSLHTKDNSTLSISENPSTIFINGPKHLRYIPLKFQNHGFGDFAIECDIDRHNNLSRYSNVIDKWILPKRAYLAKVFGRKFERISKNGLPISLNGKTVNYFKRSVENEEFQIAINLPEDLDLLNYLLTQKNKYHHADIRNNLPKSKIEYIANSDKGKNFNGVISLFKKLHIASNFLTNMLWKDLFQHASHRNKKEDYLYTRNDLNGFLTKHRNNSFLTYINKKMHFKKPIHASQYLTACFNDALNELIKYKFFHPVYTWNCRYCGYKNLKTVDSIKLYNNCEVCEEKHMIPTGKEFEWEYLLNKFIHKTILEHNGFNVLWALNFIQNLGYKNSFLYLPEVNIFYDTKNSNQLNEIDLLGIYDGNFFAGEAKRTAEYFLTDREADKFIELIKHMSPDQAFLAFGKYAEDETKIEEIKSNLEDFKKRFEAQFKNIKLTILTFENFINFSSPAIDFGIRGNNVYAFFEKLDSQ
ncbi:hypothetical protein [Acinetobacter pittii]|uniref:hypothetical protein n=1 Tax=Acinetobacter pittii TaxID=48296 RepID=UPI00246902B6|nr:hypothetical protein [Acinetobacter pittii]WGM25778.1 hypothetical protein OFU58_05660 [Acinetobacter pittii]